MKVTMKYPLTAAMFFILTSYAYAAGGYSSYKCTIEHEYKLSDDGAMRSWSMLLTKKDFVVHKATGLITGAIDYNVTGETTVLDRGSSNQAYKAMTIYGPNIWVRFLYVQQFAVGAKKPFMVIDGDQVVSGKCVDY